MTISRNTLRKQVRQARQALSPQQQQQSAQKIIPQALELIQHHQANHLAFYLPFDSEISPIPLMEQLLTMNKRIYLPVLHPFSANQLLFLQYLGKTSLKSNRFGILEPKLDVRNVLPLTQLEMIFTPLVAVDKKLNRLGMGGGFYDRTFAQAPHLIKVGLAHSCQLIEKVPSEPWDQPLDALILG